MPPPVKPRPQPQPQPQTKSAIHPADGDLPPAAAHLRERIDEAITYTRDRRKPYRRMASLIRLTSVGLSAAATVILGLQDLDPITGLAFAFSALVTVLAALEPFFNFRAIWVLLEEAQASHHRLRDDFRFYVARRAGQELEEEKLEEFHRRSQETWGKMEAAWIAQRRGGGSQP